MGDFKQLLVWRRSHELTLAVYRSTTDFPRHEVYGLTSQLRRASASIPANIAEGCGRGGDAELVRFLRISLGSANELNYHLLLARDLSYLDEQRYKSLSGAAIEVRSMLASLIGSLQQAPRRLKTVD